MKKSKDKKEQTAWQMLTDWQAMTPADWIAVIIGNIAPYLYEYVFKQP